jgi:autotransporter-associated beta strand protein
MKPNRMNPLNWSRSAGISLTSLAALLSLGGTAKASDWNGSTSTDWNIAANWSSGLPNGGGDWANIFTGPSNVPVISSDSTGSPVAIAIGGGNSRLDQTAGILTGTASDWPGGSMLIGMYGTGTYNLANTGTTGGAFTGYGTGSGSYTTGANGSIQVGAGWWWDHSTAVMNVNTSGTLQINSHLVIASNNGDNGTVNIDAGTVIVKGGWQTSSEIACGSGTEAVIGSLNMSGGTVTLDNRLSMGEGTRSGDGNANPYIYANGSNVATLTMTGGSLTDLGADGWHGGLYMATGYNGALGGSATVNLNGGTLSGVEVSMASADGATGGSASTGGSATINLNGGTLSTHNVYSASWNGGTQGTSTFNFNGGTLQGTDNHDVPWNQFIGGITHAYVKAGGAVIDTNGFNEWVGAVLEGDIASTGGGLTKNGLGQLEIGNQNTFTGAVVVNAGTLYANSGTGSTDKAFSYSSGITVNSGATLRAGSNSLFGWDGTQAKPITVNAGGVAIAAFGDQNIGLVTLNGGTLSSVSEDGFWGSWHFGRATDKKLLVTDNSTVDALHVSFTGGATIEVAAGKNLDFTGTIGDGGGDGSSSVIKNGSGTLTLSGANTYSGGTTLTAGTVALGSSGALGTTGTISFGGGTLQHSASNTTDYSSRFSTASSQAYKVDTNGQDVTWATNLTSSGGSLTKSGNGTLTLAGANTYTGNTKVNAGTLTIDSACLADSADVTIAAGATLNLNHGDTDTIRSLIVGVTPVAPGLYRASGGSGAGTPLDSLSGTGKLQVTAPVASGYAGWAASHVGGAAADEDTDKDGVANGVEYFMNAAAGFTPNPSVVTSGAVKTVTWTNGGNIPSAAYGSQFVVQTSTNLLNWTPVASTDPNLSNTSGSVTYTITGAGSQFVRLVVTPN